VQWNGSAIATTYLSVNQLTTSVAASRIANPGTASVTVVNPGGAISNAVTFTINALTPSISGLSPNSATAGGLTFTLTVIPHVRAGRRALIRRTVIDQWISEREQGPAPKGVAQ
jgi:hypothetical protein